jgi:PIN domain nuclease of toxin-antitoxin system
LKLLLDTHVWLWALSEPSRLTRRVREEIRRPENELWLSPVSTWEALLLNARGRIRLPVNLTEWLAQSTAPLHRSQHPQMPTLGLASIRMQTATAV